jgi:oligosaccharyltransferase complex subunit delta (ribophorin II)
VRHQSVRRRQQGEDDSKCVPKQSFDLKLLFQLLNSVLTSADSSVSDMYSAFMAQTALGGKIDAKALVKNLQAALKKDDSVGAVGHAFQIAAAVDGTDAAKTMLAQVEDVVVQADEVDGKMLQFEGGLSVTSLVLTGAYRLGAKVGKAPAISKMQSTKFANYFLSRKSVQTPKGCFYLMDALNTLTTNKFHIPVAVTLAGASNAISASSPKVQVRVSDVFGKSLGKMDVSVDSAMRQSDGAVIMAKTKMTPAASDAMVFEVDMMASKPGRGFYELTLSAVPSKADDRLAGNTGAVVLIKALGDVVVTESEIGVGITDQSTSTPKLNAVAHPSKYGKALEADHHQKVAFKFALEDKATKEKISAHQVFVRMTHAQSGAEIIFVAEQETNSVYKFDLDVGVKAREFGHRSGKYAMHLLVGDAVIANPINWHVADLTLTFPESEAANKVSTDQASNESGNRPEIRHLFREPEKRPPAAVSNLFTLLCIAPIAIMFMGWMLLGVNVSSFPFSITAIGFHIGLAGIFTLYYYFWLQLNMFTTIKYLLMVGVVTFLCGNSMLVKIAEKRRGA